MTTISKSTIEPRTQSLFLFGIGSTALVLGIISMQLVVILVSVGILLAGFLLYFFGKSTYKVVYDEKSQYFNLSNRKETIIIQKKDVIEVQKNLTILQTWWPLPRHYYYSLTAKNEAGKKMRYRFVIWSNQSNLLKSYAMLSRSVEKWASEKTDQKD